jgi:hypothetical protein
LLQSKPQLHYHEEFDQRVGGEEDEEGEEDNDEDDDDDDNDDDRITPK